MEPDEGGLLQGGRPDADFLLGLAEFGGQGVTEVVRAEDLADLYVTVTRHRARAALDPLDGLFLRLDLEEPEPGDQLLGLGERAVDDRAFSTGEADPGPL